MAINLYALIKEEVNLFHDRYLKKRGPRHRSQNVGLNLDRKHLNVVPDVHKADPNKIHALEYLRGVSKGQKFVSDQVGEELKEKYGIQSDNGFLGTTKIRLSKTSKGYLLSKDAN